MMESDLPEGAAAVSGATHVYLEGDIFFDGRQAQLLSATKTVALNVKESTLLQLLLAGRVKKQAVIDAAWGENGTIVTEASYHQLVRSLRKKFEEIGLPPQSIRTLPRFGLEYVREHPVVAAVPEPAAVDTPSPGAEPEAGKRPAASGHVWRLFLTALPLLIGMLIGLKGYRDGQLPIDAVANDFGIHLFDIGGVQFDAELLQQIERRSSRGEYVYMARNGPKAWLGICTHPVQKDFSFCRQDYFSLY